MAAAFVGVLPRRAGVPNKATRPNLFINEPASRDRGEEAVMAGSAGALASSPLEITLVSEIAFLACASVLAGTLTFSATAFAQEASTPKYEIGLGYSGLHTNSADSTLQRTGNGGAGSFEYNLNGTLGLVGDLGGYANTNTHDRLMTYMFGPRFNWRRGRLTPYAQFLFAELICGADGAHRDKAVSGGVPDDPAQ